MAIEEILTRRDSGNLTSSDLKLLEEIILDRMQEKEQEPYNSKLMNALETIRLCSSLLSRFESSNSSNKLIGLEDWPILEDDIIYFKLKSYLEEMESRKYVRDVVSYHGKSMYFNLANRVGYVDFIHRKIKDLDLGNLIHLQYSSGIQSTIDIVREIDSNLEKLVEWIGGKGKKKTEDLEKGTSILLSLCGFNSIHVGADYENATSGSRRNKVSIDVIALSKDERRILLCQCTVDSISDKIRDLMNTLPRMRIVNKGKGVKLYPVIVTTLPKNKIDFTEATRSKITVFTIEDLEDWIRDLNSSKSPMLKILDKLLEDQI